jgi:hypothetical protein
MIMLRALTLALLFTLFLALQPANAQGLGLPMGSLWDTYVTLTRADLDMIRSTLDQQIHNKKAGASAS